MKEEEKIRYDSFCFRLDRRTYELLKKKKIKSEKSWNLFIYNLIKKNE